MRNKRSILFGLVLMLLLPSSVVAKVRLPAFVSDHMLLQADKRVALWGWADSGESVTVSIGGQRLTALPDKQGRWTVELKPLKAGQILELIVEGSNKITVKDVAVGEVWLASGQSNMAFRLSGAARAKEETEAARFEGIRVFTVQEQFAQSPQTNVQGQWRVCSPSDAGAFSAVAYFFGRTLHTNLRLPVGLIVSAVGGTRIETWTATDTLASDPENLPLLEEWKNVKPEEFLRIAADYREYQKARDKRTEAVARGESLPEVKAPAKRCHDCPGALFNGMIAPLIPYTLRGVIWYQGENNTGHPAHYDRRFAAMVRQWRHDWRAGDFPFYFVQLPNYAAPGPARDNFAVLREGQRKTLALTNTGMAVAIDLGEAHNIHSRNKQDVGYRLALWALGNVYGRGDLVYSGPLYQSLAIEGETAVVRFKTYGSPLVAKGGALAGFELAGSDGKYFPAEGRIHGDTVELRSRLVPHPLTARYAWANDPVGCNLYNSAGLPASPFTTAPDTK